MTNEEQNAVTFESMDTSWSAPLDDGAAPAKELVSVAGASVVQLVRGDALGPDTMVMELHDATVTVTESRVVAADGDFAWEWLVADLEAVIHGADEPWTIFVVPGISDFGVMIPFANVEQFRHALSTLPGVTVRHQRGLTPLAPEPSSAVVPVIPAVAAPAPPAMPAPASTAAPAVFVPMIVPAPQPATFDSADLLEAPFAGDAKPDAMTAVGAATVVTAGVAAKRRFRMRDRNQDASDSTLLTAPATLTGIHACDISAWFGTHQVLDRVSLDMAAGEVTALIGPSGCGKSTFLRILNRMHEMIPSASLAGEVLLDGHDIYDPNRKLTDARREIGMVFQKPNPFPAMSIYDNVLASFRLTGLKASVELKDETVETCLTKAGLWPEVRDRLREPGGGLSGGQQQRLCIARALAIRPRVLLMDEPCSALDPTSTRRIEETVMELVSEVTIVIVTHNMQQAARVSNRCAFFLAEQGTPGVIVEHGPTEAMFGSPQDSRTNDYVTGRFG